MSADGDKGAATEEAVSGEVLREAAPTGSGSGDGTVDAAAPTAQANQAAPATAAESAPAAPGSTESAAAETGGSATSTAVEAKDPWAAFAPQPERAPGRLRRAAARVGAGLTHEWTAVSLGALVLAVLMTWPTLRQPTKTIPEDIWDPTLQAWQMAWSGHALTHDPGHLWQSNTFYPEAYSFAFSDTLLGYAPAGMIGVGPVAAVLRYNILYVLVFAFAFLGAYALVRQLGANKAGAAVAG